jgi:26S proteasome regulatory subunit N12
MSSIPKLLGQLESLVSAGNIDQGKQCLNQLKLLLLHAGSPSDSATALELGVLLSVSEGDLDSFGRNMAQLQPLYNSGVSTPRKAHITGLNLMHLLVENRLAEFHAQLELLTETEASDPLTSFPIALERKLMVGIYDEVGQIPDKSFQIFMDHLLQTVRDSIADCMEVAYQELSVDDAAKLLKLNNKQELLEYVPVEREDWMMESNDDKVTFAPPPTMHAASDIPSMDWIQQSLTYATELERII